MTTKAKPAAKAPAKKAAAKPATEPKAGDAKIKILANSNPHKVGTERHKRFAKLKNGMSVSEAVKIGVPSTYLHRMVAKGVLTIT